MRVFVLILLIALAPLRGMANDLMATRMAAALTASMATSAHPGPPAVAQASGHHCEDMAASAMPEHPATLADAASMHHASPTATVASHDGCENCSLCQMCASAALPAELHVALPVFSPQMQVPTRTDHFASALAALAQKPPIS